MHNWNNEEEVNFFYLYYKKILTNTKPKTLALENLKKLSENNKIVLITARKKVDFLDVESITQKWVKENNIPYHKLIIDVENKEKIAKEEKIDVFIDDSFKNCKAVSDVGIKTYIMDTRVNRDLNDENIKRIYSWPHLYMELSNK